MKNNTADFKVGDLVKVYSRKDVSGNIVDMASFTPGRIIPHACPEGMALLHKETEYPIQEFTLKQYET